MNDRLPKPKKTGRQIREAVMEKHPSASSIKHKAHCQPKKPPNIDQYHRYAHPRTHDDAKENTRLRENQPHPSSRQHHPKNNPLLQPRRTYQHPDELRRTQKKGRKAHHGSEWVSPDVDGLGCHQHLTSQIFRHSGTTTAASLSQRPTGLTGFRPLNNQLLTNHQLPLHEPHPNIEDQLQLFQEALPAIAWKEDQQSLAQLVQLEEDYSRQGHCGNYLQRQPNLTWKRRALALDWAMEMASELNCRREAFAVAVNLLDRYLAASPPLPLDQLQLTTTACLLIAEKLQDNSRIRTSNFHERINQRHSLEELLGAEVEVAVRLKFRLKAPTVNAWASRLCGQWDMWMELEGSPLEARFRAADNDSYHNWRWMAQYIDFALLDIDTAHYKNRTLAASFLYLTLLLKQQLYSPQEVALRFRKEPQCVLESTPFNQMFSRFLMDSFGFPLQEILPTVQYCSGFTLLPLSFELPSLIREAELPFEEYCGIQTWNESNRAALEQLDRNFW